MPNEMSNSSFMTEINYGLVPDSSYFPYLMQYQFTGNIFPSFSSVRLVPVDIRIAYATLKNINWGTDYYKNYFQIRAAWSTPSEKHSFRERHNYHSARFDFFYQKINKKVYRIPDFAIYLAKVEVVLKKDLFEGQFIHLDNQGVISISFKHIHKYGNLPHILNSYPNE